MGFWSFMAVPSLLRVLQGYGYIRVVRRIGFEA